jgi:Hydroxymethylglutaryl-coenzyme A synthase N terminal
MQENGAPRQPEHTGILALEVYVPPTYVRLNIYSLMHLAHKAVTITSMQASLRVCSAIWMMPALLSVHYTSGRHSQWDRHCAAGALQVSQEELEAHDGVAAGKYTAGLGQVCNS